MANDTLTIEKARKADWNLLSDIDYARLLMAIDKTDARVEPWEHKDAFGSSTPNDESFNNLLRLGMDGILDNIEGTIGEDDYLEAIRPFYSKLMRK